MIIGIIPLFRRNYVKYTIQMFVSLSLLFSGEFWMKYCRFCYVKSEIRNFLWPSSCFAFYILSQFFNFNPIWKDKHSHLSLASLRLDISRRGQKLGCPISEYSDWVEYQFMPLVDSVPDKQHNNYKLHHTCRSIYLDLNLVWNVLRVTFYKVIALLSRNYRLIAILSFSG